MSDQQSVHPFTCGYVAVVGPPNVGKSTLINRLVGSKLSIVSPRPQTTRSIVRGILTTEQSQIIFLDTAGMHRPRDGLGSYMVASTQKTYLEADLVYLLVDSTRPGDRERAAVEDIRQAAKKTFLLINKIDLVNRETLLPLIDEYSGHMDFDEIIPVSARDGENTDRLLECTCRQLPEAPPLYPPDILSDQIERDFIGEFIREQIYHHTRDEIPYSTAVVVEDMTERPNGGAYIQARMYVEKESQKGIIIGRRGEMIKKIGAAARADIESFLGSSVYIDLQVKVEKKWRDRQKSLKKLGYR